MLPNDQMVEAASDALRQAGTPAPRERASIALRAGLAALDRAALIDAGARGLWEQHGTTPEMFADPDERDAAWANTLDDVEAVLRAVGLLP